tara:strand:- start:8362 stop:8766 length:405 start_codon:yes stop_codon:yes gene_type:complete
LNLTRLVGVLTDFFIIHGVPVFIRSGNGPEFVAQAVRYWIQTVGAKATSIEPGLQWKNGYCESFNAWLWDELLNGEIFDSRKEDQRTVAQALQHVTSTFDLGIPAAFAGITNQRYLFTNIQTGPIKRESSIKHR